VPDRPCELRPIGQVRIEVTDVDRAVAFYRDVLGMAFLYAIPEMGLFDADGVRIMLAEP
jgi:methylmalonyl-CoA/ethylmalonyl-CoA epimerase